MCGQETVVETLHYGHRQNDQTVFMRFEGSAKQVSNIPDHGCLFSNIDTDCGKPIITHVLILPSSSFDKHGGLLQKSVRLLITRRL